MRRHVLAAAAVTVVALVLIGLFQIWNSGRSNESFEKKVSRLPAFQTKTIDGRKVSAESYQGKILIVNFWASWCAPCLEEIPSLVTMAKKFSENIRLLAISNDLADEEITAFLKSFPEFKAPLVDLVHDQPPSFPLTHQFDVGKLPESYIFDRQGRLIRRVIGTIDWSTPDALQYMESLIKAN